MRYSGLRRLGREGAMGAIEFKGKRFSDPNVTQVFDRKLGKMRYFSGRQEVNPMRLAREQW